PNGSPPVTRFTLPACCAHYPGEPNRGARRLLACSCCLPQTTRRVGVRIGSFEACSGFNRGYGPLDRSATFSGLCHEAPAPPVAQLNRSSATGQIDNYPDGICLHW